MVNAVHRFSIERGGFERSGSERASRHMYDNVEMHVRKTLKSLIGKCENGPLDLDRIICFVVAETREAHWSDSVILIPLDQIYETSMLASCWLQVSTYVQ